MIGQTLSHYRIAEKLGQGGMGEVYRAQDLTLGRDVAIKVLPEAFTLDPDRVARFQREAKVLASLNHPNIAAIHGLEVCDGTHFLVLELVEGETLADQVKRGPIPIEDSLKLAAQIAEALEAAHEKGIVHRDLKPANIKIKPDGQVKILDFGLAKVKNTPQAPTEDSPTLTMAETQSGVILGTAAYMSPEQASGKPVDKRTDIWSFGVVLWEMLTGRRLFEAETISHTIADVLRAAIDFDQLPGTTPVVIRRILRRCLDRDAQTRLRDIGEVRIAIGESANTEFLAQECSSAPRPTTSKWVVAYVAAALVAGIFVGVSAIKYFGPPASVPMTRAIIKVEAGRWLGGWLSSFEMYRPSKKELAISSDGRFIVYSASPEKPDAQAKPMLYLRRIDEIDATPILGTEGGSFPFLSPDNRLVGFWADGKLKKISVEGGIATELCGTSPLMGANWGAENRIVFSNYSDSAISVVSADEGKPEILVKPDAKTEYPIHRLPSWLPNEKAILFTAMRYEYDLHPAVGLLRMDTRKWSIVLGEAADARYVSTGHILFLRQGTLMAVRFDLGKLEVVGQPVAVTNNVVQMFSSRGDDNTGAGQFSVSDNGSLIYAAGGIAPEQQNTLVWVDQKGNEQPVTDRKFAYFGPRLSPDGQKIAYVTSLTWQIWVYDLISGANSRLVNAPKWFCYPIWSPDGKRLMFFVEEESRKLSPYWQPYDKSEPMEQVTSSEYSLVPGSWSNDGHTVASLQVNRSGTNSDGWELVMLDVHSKRVTPFLKSQFSMTYPDFSPDGRLLAYTGDESGRNEIYVVPYPNKEWVHQVSSQGGMQPLWAKNGRQLYYRNRDQVWVVDIQTDGGFRSSKPRLLFERSGYGSGEAIRSYDLSLDGQRFLMVKLDQRAPSPVTEMILVQNWFEELKRLCPTGR